MWTHSFVILIFDVSSLENRWRIGFNSNINFQLRDFRNFLIFISSNSLSYSIQNPNKLELDEYLSSSCKQLNNTYVNIGKNGWMKFENLIHFQEMSYSVDYLTWQCLDTHARVTILANFMRRRCEILFGMLFNFCHILFSKKKVFCTKCFCLFCSIHLIKTDILDIIFVFWWMKYAVFHTIFYNGFLFVSDLYCSFILIYITLPQEIES